MLSHDVAYPVIAANAAERIWFCASIIGALYVGDGLWDLRACSKLGIPFLGVGHRRQMLRDAGASHVLENLAPADFWEARTKAKKPNKTPEPVSLGQEPR